MSMHADNSLAYMHIYKCGGTTFNWVLQRAFPKRVLYCENSDPQNKHLEKCQLDTFRENTNFSYAALSSHLIRYNALSDFEFVVTILRNPAKRLLSAFNFDKVRGNYSGDFNSYIECRTNFMSWALGNDFIADIDTGRIFCCILEDFDLSMVSLEHFLAIRGLEVDLAAPKILNAAKNINSGNQITSITADQLERIQCLNHNDYELYNLQSEKLKGFCMAIPDLKEKMNDYRKRKEEALKNIPNIKSYGQGPNHFTFL